MDIPLLIDSNIYIGLLRRRLDPASVLFEHYDTTSLITCGLVRLEVLRGLQPSRARDRLDAFFSVMLYVEADTGLWNAATVIAAASDRRGHPIGNTDAFIAACALRRGAAVLTRDRDFDLIDGLTVLRPPSGLID